MRITDTIASADVEALHDALHRFNVEATGYDDGRSLSCILRDEHGEIVAGIDGHTWGGWAHVDVLFVAATRRGTGLGSRMLAAAEAEAARRGCRFITLGTHSFQAPDFYRTRGYEVVSTIDDAPLGHRDLMLRKMLAPAGSATPRS